MDQLSELSSQMQLEPGEEKDCLSVMQPSKPLPARKFEALNISHATLPGGKRMPLLKTLLTSACERDCFYCPFRAGRDFRRATLSPDEMAQAFVSLYQAGIVQGMFLSSGVAGGGLTTQDKIIAVAEILRQYYQFKGYIHLKIMPGSEFSQVEKVMKLADRISINLEAPNSERLAQLAPHKSFADELITPMHWIETIRRQLEPRKNGTNPGPSLTTQFVVGAVGETDMELMSTTQKLTEAYHLKRAYYSAFNPMPDTPLENHPPTSHLREHRLYQASFLIRDYGFSMEDLPFETSGNLPIHMDPKLAWAKMHLVDQPLEINTADQLELLRIPGIGLKGAERILSARKSGKLKDPDDLKKIGITSNRFMPYVLLDGKQPNNQLSLWALDKV